MSAATHLSLKSSGETSGGLRSIASKASLREPVITLAAEGAKGDGGEGTSLDLMTCFGVFFLSCDEEFRGQK